MKTIKNLKTIIMKTIEKTKTIIMKKEKKVKAVPTQEQLDKMVIDYLKCSEKHIFQTKYVWDKEYKENYYKVFPKMLNGKTYYVTIKFGEGKVDAKVVDTSWVKTKNHLGMMKNEVFPQCVEHKSIKLSFEMRVKMDIVKKLILESSDIESLKVDVKKVLQ